MQAPARHTTYRELDRRSADGIDVALVWDATDNETFVVVDDRRGRERLWIAVPGSKALDAFRHPYAYMLELPEAA